MVSCTLARRGRKWKEFTNLLLRRMERARLDRLSAFGHSFRDALDRLAGDW